MYLGFTFENIVTVGVMLALWIVALHIAAQFGLRFASWLPG